MKKVALLCRDETSVANVTGALQVFDIANVLWNLDSPSSGPLFECSVISPEKTRRELCGGITVEMGRSFEPYEQADVVLAPGFLYQDFGHLIEKVETAKKTIGWICKQYYQGALIAASCSGTMLLGESKLLDGKSATTSWWLGDLFRSRYPDVNVNTDSLLIEHGRLISAGAASSYLNLVLYLIEKIAGKDFALNCSKITLIDLNKHYQTPYISLYGASAHAEKVVTQAQFWINEHFQEQFNAEELAAHVSVSYRTLVRKFKAATGDTPKKYLQKVRIEAAKRLLETTDLNLETIMARVGYSDPSSFQLLFKRLTQLTPHVYRAQFSIV